MMRHVLPQLAQNNQAGDPTTSPIPPTFAKGAASAAANKILACTTLPSLLQYQTLPSYFWRFCYGLQGGCSRRRAQMACQTC
jgi:hypothetical protein